ncbi:MAG: hypothetical protein ACHQNE_06415 [Candidatus Kapaibacterium sp.]
MESSSASAKRVRPEEELQFIRKIIAESRTTFVEDGAPYIWWGLIVAIGMGVNYLSVLLQRDLYAGFIWLGLILAGWGTTLYYVLQKKKQAARAKSFLDRIAGAIWGTCGSTLGLGLLLILSQTNFSGGKVPPIYPLYACFFASMILGIAYYLTGVVNDLRWFRNLGFAWWAGGVAMYLWPSVHVMGLYALMLILFQVVPGIVLQRRNKRIRATEA